MLVKTVDMDAGQVSRNLKTLIASGLILSRVDRYDLRQQVLQLTSAGSVLHGQLEPVMERRHEMLLAGISEHRQRIFFAALDQVESNMQEPGE